MAVRDDLREVFGEGLSEEQEDALYDTSAYLQYLHQEIVVAEFRRVGRKVLEGMMDEQGGDWRDGYYEALSRSLCGEADRLRTTREVRSALPADLFSSPEQIEAWLDATEKDEPEVRPAGRGPRVAEVSVMEWGYARSFHWRCPASILGTLAQAGRALKRLGWEADEARGYVLTGKVPAYSRVSGSVTWDAREFHYPRVSLSIDPSALPDEVVAAFSAQRKALLARARAFSRRALELHRHTTRVPKTRQEWEASLFEWNDHVPDVSWRYYELPEYKAAVRRVHKALLERILPNEGEGMPVNRRQYLGGP